jgi:hypothetical protein
MPKIEKGKQYKTENGLDVEFTHWNTDDVCGVVKNKYPSGEICYDSVKWNLISGIVNYHFNHVSCYNLVEVKPRIK